MGALTFGNADRQETTTISPNNQITVTDQGVAVAPRNRSGNTSTTYRLGRNASLTLGLTGEQVTAAINAALQQHDSQTDTTTGTSGGGLLGGLNELIASRFGLNASTAGDAATASNPLRLQKLLIAAVAVVGIFALFIVLKRRKG